MRASDDFPFPIKLICTVLSHARRSAFLLNSSSLSEIWRTLLGTMGPAAKSLILHASSVTRIPKLLLPRLLVKLPATLVSRVHQVGTCRWERFYVLCHQMRNLRMRGWLVSVQVEVGLPGMAILNGRIRRQLRVAQPLRPVQSTGLAGRQRRQRFLRARNPVSSHRLLLALPSHNLTLLPRFREQC